jgi:ribonuclease G
VKQIKKQILANSTTDETRVALLENNQLAEFFIDRPLHGAAQVVRNIYHGKVENVLPGISSAFIDIGQEKNAYLYITDVVSEIQDRGIDKLIKRGENILVQVAKEAIGTKGMKVTMDISLPGRFLSTWASPGKLKIQGRGSVCAASLNPWMFLEELSCGRKPKKWKSKQ